VWKSVVDGEALHFRLVGLNNQNFLMEDVETGTWWQQVTGEAVLGPLAGRKLERIPFDLVSFELWRGENPRGAVLEPDERYRDRYASADWDERASEMPKPARTTGGPFETRDLVVGLTVGDRAKAYRMSDLVAQSPVADRVGSRQILILVAADGRSVRCFDREIDGAALDLFAKPEAQELTLVDAGTGSEWSFAGEARRGPLAGRKLERLPCIQDFWFDWKTHYPETATYVAGASR
jgi:hypothetical protein